MKKFIVSLLGIFLLFGASVLTACNKGGSSLTLSQDTVAIELFADDEDSGYELVTATLSGVKEGSIQASARSGFENIVKVTQTRRSSNSISIRIEALEEGSAQVVVRGAPGNHVKYINVNVFSYVSSMSQVAEDGDKKNNFLIRGSENILDEHKLISFAPSDKSLYSLTWDLSEEMAGVQDLELEGNTLTVGNSFPVGQEVKLVATTERGVSTTITLPVIDKIEDEINFQFSYSQNSSFEDITSDNNSFNIVPNIPSDASYQGYILLDYAGDLEITPYVLNSAGRLTDDIQVLENGRYNDKPLYTVYASKDKSNINDDYKVGFKIGYKNYNYFLDTIENNPIIIKAREMVNSIIVSTRDANNIAGSTQTLYTNYADSSDSTINGQRFDLSITPTTVVDMSNKYRISVSRWRLGGEVSNGCPVEIWYRDAVNGNGWRQIDLREDENHNFTTQSDMLPNVKTLYIKASEGLKVQSNSDYRITFTSDDNPNISTYFNLKLVKSASISEFVFNDASFKVDSSELTQVYKKVFNLKGQTSIDGLKIRSESGNVTFGNIIQVASDGESVDFEVSFTLNNSSYGVTSQDSYYIVHENGLVSSEYSIDIFLPLKQASMQLDVAENKSQSVIDYALSENVYDDFGTSLGLSQSSLSSLTLKNNTTTPLIYSYNKIGQNSAVANISVKFYDYEGFAGTVSDFKALSALEIIRGAQTDSSNVVYFTSDFSSIVTKGVGRTYAIVSFTGKGVGDNVDANGNVTFTRIIYIESLVTPDGINIVPDGDKYVTLYSPDTLATSDESLTRKDVRIRFSKGDITYKTTANVEFISGRNVMGSQSVSADGTSISWAQGRYSLSNVNVSGEGITFNIIAEDTYGENIFTDTLNVHYVIRDEEQKRIYDIYTTIEITIKNAQRVESLKWKTYDADGLYFEVGDNSPQYLLLDISPTNARNRGVAYLITDEKGAERNSFITVGEGVSSDTLAVNLESSIREGMTGYIYVLPADAIYNNQIKYYYVDSKGVEQSNSISYNLLAENYDYLVSSAYFKSNATGGDVRDVKFSDILIKIKVTVADGKSFDYAYRIYDASSFASIRSDLYYRIMNDIDLSGQSRGAITNFSGGLEGKTSDITIKLDGDNFARTLTSSGEIRNLTFIGNVQGNGFIVDVNNGAIKNVKIDVNGRKASTLQAGVLGGGIAGENNNLIENASVLGLTITARTSDSYVGGIAGQNDGRIEASRVEFYNLEKGEDENGNMTYGVNTFTGNYVGGLVGLIGARSSINFSYAYDYTLADGSSKCLNATTISGAFAGTVTGSGATITNSFSVIGEDLPSDNYENVASSVTITRSYMSYFSGEYYSRYFDENGRNNSSSVVFVQRDNSQFKAYVNGGNPYLPQIMQDERVTTVDYSVASVKDDQDYNKALAVNSTRGIVFFYKLENNASDLTSSEMADLNELNTISLSQLVGEEVNRNVIVSSSNSQIIKTVGSSLIVLKTGEVTLTLSSKQDVTLSKDIKVNVVYAMSDMVISWADNAGRVTTIQDGTMLALQKTTSRTYNISYDKTEVYLGSLASRYILEQNEITINVKNTLANGAEGNIVDYEISGSDLKLITGSDSGTTNFEITPVVFADRTLQSAIDGKFKRNFTLNPIDGVIDFDIAGDELPITPSIKGEMEVRIRTTDVSDSVYPVISFNGDTLIAKEENGVYRYSIRGREDAILEVTVNRIKAEEGSNNLNTYTYVVTFSVCPDKRAEISEDMEFDVYIMSKSGNTSKEENGGEFKLTLTRQNFTNIDVSNKKISESHYYMSGDNVVEVHRANELTSVLAPGNSSILEVNVNPSYAYYDYAEITYSGATVSNAVNIEVMTPYAGSDENFMRRPSNGDIDVVANALRFYPDSDEKGTLYYKLWIDTTVNRDTTLQFRIAFYEKGGKEITYVNYFVSISYLTEPVVTIDGQTTAYIAKGSTAIVKIDVLADQSIDSLMLDGENIKDVTLTQPSKPVVDTVRGIKTYEARLTTFVTASAENSTIYILAQISRELNGSKEIKNSVATGVIVNFKIDDDIIINDRPDGVITLWQGVPRAIGVDYNILPESYNLASDEESEKAIAYLQGERNIFKDAGFYPAKAGQIGGQNGYVSLDRLELENYDYFVNYKYDENKELQVKNLLERIFVISGNERIPLADSSVNTPVSYSFDEITNSISMTGTRISSGTRMVLETYVSAGGITQTIDTYFTINVEAYSDPDLPLLIKNASDFENLRPTENSTEIVTNDYILTNDIVLENYTSFNTDLIRSLDGNGYTIFIKSYDVEGEGTLNLALFNRVLENTLLKNVRVNLYNGGQLTIDIDKHSDINIAGLAIENSGIITNCEVVAFYTESRAMGLALAQNACEPHNGKAGFNVKYIRGENTTESIFITDNPNWSTQMAGFVISNSGSITNSRVGGDSITILGSERTVNGKPNGYTDASTLELGTFYMIGQGNMAGFVITNSSGNISTCYVKNIDMENQSNSTSYYAVGFVGTNSANISVSYIEGVPTPKSQEDSALYSAYAYEGSSIKSKMGYVVGFVYRNNNSINDCYSNILIANSEASNSVYLASGFVYENVGTIENAYSASQIKNSMNTQMNFSGVDKNGYLLANGTYINCYFFNKLYENSEEPTDNTTETLNNTGAMLIPSPDNASDFYGFAIASGERDGIWRVVEDEGISLITTEILSISHRYIYYVDGDNFEGVTGEDEIGKYILPYSTLSYTNSSLEIDTSLGGSFNPIIISDAEDFVEVSGTSQSSYIREYFNSSAMWGTYRLVNNISLTSMSGGESLNNIPSSVKAFSGTFYGNNFTISGISLATENPAVSIGLFKSIEKRGRNNNPMIIDLNLAIDMIDGSVASMAGGLAGYIKDAIIVGVNVNYGESGKVTALNFAGGIAGLVFGDNKIRSITVTNPNITAKKYLNDDNSQDDYFFSDENRIAGSLQALRTSVENNLNYNTLVSSALITSLEKYSYAGGIFGLADIFATNNINFDINQADNYVLNNVRVNGNVYVEGQIVGGAIGLTGYQTNIRDLGVVINSNSDSHIIATKYYAGGVIGQSFGSNSRIFATYDEATQAVIENKMANFYAGKNDFERGNLNLFNLSGTNYKQVYIGGLIGAAFGGTLEVSYSKLNVTSMTADYAGGLVGGLMLEDAAAYLVDERTSIYSTYFIKEAYATGDVRARVMAGGIIGRIVSIKARVALQSVNAVNYFTTYDYINGVYAPINPEMSNFSEIYNVNAFVGEFAKYDNSGEIVPDDLNNKTLGSGENTAKPTDFTNYIIFLQKNAEGDSSTGETGALPSVGFYQGYYTGRNGEPISLNMFGKIDSNINTNPYTRDDAKLAFAISSPNLYDGASVGYQYTNVAFLGSNVWDVANWKQDIDELFPSIKYKRSSSVLYLDNYNIDTVFKKMAGGNYTVYIRGRVAEGSEECANIDLIKYYNNGGAEYIERFSGRLRGGIYPVDSDQKVKIITDRTFIKSVAPGFSATNVEVVYTKESYENSATSNLESIAVGRVENDGGLFIASEADNVVINNLKLILNDEISFYFANGTSNQVKYAGLVAPTLVSSTLSGISITRTTAGGGSSGYIMNVNGSKQEERDLLYVGLIAGSISQKSTVSTMVIENVSLDFEGDLISINSDLGFQNYNIGTYFGLANRASNAQPLRVSISKIERSGAVVGNQKPQIIIQGEKAVNSVNIGGYIGVVADEGNAGIDDLSSYAGDAVSANVTLCISPEVKGLINAGGIIGSLNSALTFIAGQSTVNESLIIERDANNVNAGGFAGYVSGGALSVNGFAGIEFGVLNKVNDAYNKGTQILSEKEELDGGYDESYNVEVTGTANIGGLVGMASTSVSYDNSSRVTINARVEDDEKVYVNTFALSAKTVNAGSIIGSSVARVKISANVLSNTEFRVKSTNAQTNVGGMVGSIVMPNISSSDSDVNINTDSQIGDTGKTLFYDGATYSNSNNLCFGGILGHYSGENGTKLTITNAYFGGVAKVYGTNSNGGAVTFGGILGNAYIHTGATNSQVVLSLNYTYGDMFVEYGTTLSSLKTYNFGGVIGNLLSGLTYNVTSNYSLTTSHNARYNSSIEVCTQNALFGNGGSVFDEQGNTLGNNAYNHSVSLCNDEYGNDISYNDSAYNGYQGARQDNSFVNTHSDIARIISNNIRGYTTINTGHKLSPGSIQLGSLSAELSDASTFNGITYYNINNEILDPGKDQFEELRNVALFGNGGKLAYRNEGSLTDFITAKSSIIGLLTGYSSVSGFVLDVNASYDVAMAAGGETAFVAPLVSQMEENSIVYAINVQGTLDYGGSGNAIVAGLVGNLVSGKIFDCSTDLDISFRGSQLQNNDNAGIFGIAYMSVSEKPDDDYRLIENTYSAGSIKTYISIDVYAFSNEAGSSDKTKVYNCYTITKLDLKDYTRESLASSGYFYTFGKGVNDKTFNSCFYDKDALNANLTSGGKSTNVSHTELRNNKYGDKNTTIFANASKWTTDYAFNYGYPTLKYGYLNPSSYVVLEKSESKLKRLLDKGQSILDPTTSKLSADGNNNLYDNFVVENSYSRLPNGEQPKFIDNKLTYAGNDCYYMIPNGAILAKMNETYTLNKENVGLKNNFILKYDINLANTSRFTTSFSYDTNVSAISGLDFTGTFDGQNKTIQNSRINLFRSLNEATVRNLRITDFASADKPTLANEIISSTVSNMTLSGDIKGSTSSINIGGLALTAINSKLETITNLVSINVNVQTKLTTEISIAAGGLVGIISNTRVDFCSNYGPINVRVNNDGKMLAVGGLVGVMYDGNENNTISYSYNSSSVLGNYVNDSSEQTTQGLFFTGGLVGYNVGGVIKNSYNTGMVKSGNKSNTAGTESDISENNNKITAVTTTGEGFQTETKQSEFWLINNEKTTFNEDQLYSSYAGGIAGYIAGGVDNCYNEGTVEALGENPHTKWIWRKVNGDPVVARADITRLSYEQTSNRNVYAYGIGATNNSSTISNSTIRLYNMDSDYSTIYSNGASRDSGEIYWRTFKDIIDSGVMNTFYQGEKAIYSTLHLWQNLPDINIWLGAIVSWLYLFDWTQTWIGRQVVFTTTFQIPKVNEVAYDSNFDEVTDANFNSDKPNPNECSESNVAPVNTLSTDALGLAIGYQITFHSKYKVQQNKFTYAIKSGTANYSNFNDLINAKWSDKKNELDEGIYEDGDSVSSENVISQAYSSSLPENLYYKESYERRPYEYDEFNKSFNWNNLCSNEYKEGEVKVVTDYDSSTMRNIKENTRSVEEEGEINSLKIAGNPYYILDHNNVTSVLNSGIFISKPQKVRFSSDKLPYIANKGLYSMEIKGHNELNPIITSVSQEGNETIVEYKVSSAEEINIANCEVIISMSYEQEVTFDLSSLKYSYYDDYSVGIEIGLMDYSVLDQYTLYYENSKEPDGFAVKNNVIRIRKEGASNVSDTDDANENYIYLFYDEAEGKFVYVPNAGLITSTGKKIEKINKSNYSLRGDENFIENVKNIINELKGKTYYSRVTKQSSTYASLFSNNQSLFTRYYESNGNYTAGESSKENAVIKYGSTVSNVIGAMIYENDGYVVTLDNNGKDIIALNGTTPVMSYNSSTDLWYSDINSIEGMSAQVVGNKLKILSSESTEAQNKIQTYLNKLMFISDDWSEKEFISKYENIRTSIRYNIPENESYGVDFIRTIKHDWIYNADNKFTFKEINNRLYIAVDSDYTALTKYSLGGVTVSYGEENIEITDSYTSKITSFSLRSPGRVSVEISFSKNGTTHTFKNFTSSNNHSASFDKEMSDAITDGIFNMQLKYYPSYTTNSVSVDEGYNYHLVLEKNGQIYYVEASFDEELINNAQSGITATIDSVSKIYTSSNGNLLIRAEYLESKTQEGAVSKTKVYSINGTKVLTINETEGELEYTVYYDSDGNLLYTPAVDKDGNPIKDEHGNDVPPVEGDTTESKPSNIYYRSNIFRPGTANPEVIDLIGDGYISSVDDLHDPLIFNESLKMISDEHTETIKPASSEGAGDGVSVKVARRYVYLEADYKIIENATIKNNKVYSEDIKLYSEVQMREISYKEFLMPEYNMINISFAYNGMNFDKNELSSFFVGAELIEDKYYKVQGNAIDICLRNNEEQGIIRGVLEGSVSESDVTLTATGTKEEFNVLLRSDISVDEQLNFSGKYNIIGDGYYLAFKSNTLYATIYNGNGKSFISNILFLGDTYGEKSFLVGNTNNSTKFYDVKLYGSVTNANNNNSVIINGASQILIDSYLSINGYNTDKNITLYGSCSLIDSEKSANKGVIVTARGKDGFGYVNGGTGKKGEDGGKITAGSENSKLKIKNAGVIVLGSGGSGYHGKEKSFNYSQAMAEGISQYAGGIKGSDGKVVGIDNIEGQGMIHTLTNSESGKAGFIQRARLENDVVQKGHLVLVTKTISGILDAQAVVINDSSRIKYANSSEFQKVTISYDRADCKQNLNSLLFDLFNVDKVSGSKLGLKSSYNKDGTLLK